MKTCNKTIKVICENEYKNWKPKKTEVIKNSKKILEYYLANLSENSCLEGFEYKKICFSLYFCNSLKTQELNRDYRSKDKPADIITFSIFADGENKFVLDDEINLGEIVIALDKVESQVNKDVSNSQNKNQELYFLISHGLMHLLGFDHQSEIEYNYVVEWQRKALEAINYDKI